MHAVLRLSPTNIVADEVHMSGQLVVMGGRQTLRQRTEEVIDSLLKGAVFCLQSPHGGRVVSFGQLRHGQDDPSRHSHGRPVESVDMRAIAEHRRCVPRGVPPSYHGNASSRTCVRACRPRRRRAQCGARPQPGRRAATTPSTRRCTRPTAGTRGRPRRRGAARAPAGAQPRARRGVGRACVLPSAGRRGADGGRSRSWTYGMRSRKPRST